MVRFAAPGPAIVTLLVTNSSPVVNVINAGELKEKLMVSLLPAEASAARKVPAPLSAVLVTVIVVAKTRDPIALARRNAAANELFLEEYRGFRRMGAHVFTLFWGNSPALVAGGAGPGPPHSLIPPGSASAATTLISYSSPPPNIVICWAMFDSLFWAFITLAALLTITPGADTILTLRNTLSGGTRDGLCTMAGICSGFVFQPLLATFGVAALFVRLPLAFAVVKMAGAFYLVYLGIGGLREAVRLWKERSSIETAGVDCRKCPGSRWRCYREGLLTNALNPKIAVFYFAVLPQFIKPNDPVLMKSFIMTFCHYAMGVI